IEVQDFLVIPRGFTCLADALEAIVAVHRATRDRLNAHGYRATGVADEGGWGPALANNEAALDMLANGDHMDVAVDVAAAHFFREGAYRFWSEKRVLSSSGMVDMLADWCSRYGVVSIEDGLAEDDWDGWRLLTER